MNLDSIKQKLQNNAIFYSEEKILEKPTIIGYDKKFKWSWMATQLNTFIVVSNFESTPITIDKIEEHLNLSFNYAEKHYSGWPRGLQSGIGVISVLISDSIEKDAKEYCTHLKSSKKWAGFTIPVVVHASTNEFFFFNKYPIWGRVYYPYFKKLILSLK